MNAVQRLAATNHRLLFALAATLVISAGCTNSDGGVQPDLNALCNSGSFWTRGNHGSKLMNPGLPCVECHAADEPSRAYFFMGTVFSDLHEGDLCNAPPPAGGIIEIIDANGDVALTMTPNSVGNFYQSSRQAGIALPYTARLRLGDQVKEMTEPQTSGDCNSCHTEQGAHDAPGRIAWPS